MNDIHFLELVENFFAAFIGGIGWAILFNSPKKSLWVAGFLGGIGRGARFLLMEFNFGIIPSTLFACMLLGFLGIYFTHKIHITPIVYTMPACITMIPGISAYRAMLAWIKVCDDSSDIHHNISNLIYNFVLTGSLLVCLSVGLIVCSLFFRTDSVKHVKIKDVINYKK